MVIKNFFYKIEIIIHEKTRSGGYSKTPKTRFHLGKSINTTFSRHTHLASRASAKTPAASGAAADVPECVVVHFPYKSVVACETDE